MLDIVIGVIGYAVGGGIMLQLLCMPAMLVWILYSVVTDHRHPGRIWNRLQADSYCSSEDLIKLRQMLDDMEAQLQQN